MRSRAGTPPSDFNGYLQDSEDSEQPLARLGRRTLSFRKLINQQRYMIAASVSNNAYTTKKEVAGLQHRNQTNPRKAIPEAKRSSSSFGFHSPTWSLPAIDCHTEQRTRKLLEAEIPHTKYAQLGSLDAEKPRRNNFETWNSASNVWTSVKRVLRSSSVMMRHVSNY